ncbi:hypothetical protein IEQ34_023766 [Dendrobium chrysotoxum]|uniref:Uncharacterized protein n=1 Tax=Dendrobium chrysotoxum TaxID=161865 RepID=A0AAV7FJN6_DENCH|nr:hypothetical protein IEQ34_023766 [Dendrobium chrysotoxum]
MSVIPLVRTERRENLTERDKKNRKSQLIMMFPLHFHYEDVSRQDPLLKRITPTLWKFLDRVKSD